MRLKVISVEGPLMWPGIEPGGRIAQSKKAYTTSTVKQDFLGLSQACHKHWLGQNMFYSLHYVNKLIWSGKSERGIKSKTKRSALNWKLEFSGGLPYTGQR
jgi:hypothetical protein